MNEPEYTGQTAAVTRTGSWAGFTPPLVIPGPPAPPQPPVGPPLSGPPLSGPPPAEPRPAWPQVAVTVPQAVLAPTAPPGPAKADTAKAEAGVTASQAGDRSIVGFVPLLVVLACTAVGVYIAWRQGSAGGGLGGAVAGAALLAAAVARLVLPARLAGLLATRKRATDVLTLTALGASLLVAGLVLPR